MAGNRFNTDRMVSKEVLDQLYDSVDFFANDTDYISVKELLESINTELRPPLRMMATNPTIDRTVRIQSAIVDNIEHGRRRVPAPVNKKLIDLFVEESMTFPASSGGNITKTAGASQVLIIPDDSYMKVGVHIDEFRDIQLSFGTPSASETTAGAPAPIRKTWQVGYILLRTIGSTVQNIPHDNLYQYVGSGSGSGGAGDPIEVSGDHQAEADQVILARSVRVGWKNKSIPENNNWDGVAFSPKYNRVVAIARDGTNQVAYSDDLGDTWTLTTTPAASNWREVYWIPEREVFIAITSTQPAISPDGINWFIGSAPSGSYQEAAYMTHVNRFVKVSTTTTYGAYSDDGSIWTAASGLTAGNWRSVAYSPTLEVAVAVGDSGLLAYTTDGITWSAGSGVGVPNRVSVVWASGLNKFIAVGGFGVYSSTDGINWTTDGSLAESSKLVRYSPKHELVTCVGTAGLFTSADGITFDYAGDVPNGVSGGQVESMMWSEEAGRYFMVCSVTTRDRFYVSEGFKNLPTITSMTVGSNAHDVAYSPTLNRFVAVRDNSAIVYSDDGITWTSASGTYATGQFWRIVTWIEVSGHFLATAASGTAFARSTDGITWNDAETGITSSDWTATGYAKGLNTVIYLNTASTNTRRSTNGGVTSVAGGTLPAAAFCVAFSPKLGLWVACGNGTAAYSATNGVSWVAASGVPAGGSYFSVAWSPELEMFVALDDSGTDTMYSVDGMTWAAVSRAPTILGISRVTIKWVPERQIFIGIGSGTYRIYFSRDGLNWESYKTTAFTAGNGAGIAFGQNKFVIVGNGATTGAILLGDSDEGGTYVITLPASPEFGDTVKILDAENSFTDDPIIVAGNGAKIAGTTEDLILDISGESVELVYSADSNNWAIK